MSQTHEEKFEDFSPDEIKVLFLAFQEFDAAHGTMLLRGQTRKAFDKMRDEIERRHPK